MIERQNRRSAKKVRLSAAIAAIAVAAAVAGPSARPFATSPVKIRFEVEPVPGKGPGTWLRMSGEYESVFGCSMDDIIETLWDFESSPRVFERIESVRVRSDTGSVAVTEQRTAIRVLGFSYVSDLVFKSEVSRLGPSSAYVSFDSIETDEKTEYSRGGWLLEEVAAPDGAATRVRYSTESVFAGVFPGEEALLRGFGDGDIRKLVKELGKEVESRSRASG